MIWLHLWKRSSVGDILLFHPTPINYEFFLLDNRFCHLFYLLCNLMALFVLYFFRKFVDQCFGPFSAGLVATGVYSHLQRETQSLQKDLMVKVREWVMSRAEGSRSKDALIWCPRNLMLDEYERTTWKYKDQGLSCWCTCIKEKLNWALGSLFTNFREPSINSCSFILTEKYKV